MANNLFEYEPLRGKKPPKRLRELVGKDIEITFTYDERFNDVVGKTGTILSVVPDELYQEWVLETSIITDAYIDGPSGFRLFVGSDRYRVLKKHL